MRRIAAKVLCFAAVLAVSVSAAPTEQYISGYATAVLRQKYSLEAVVEFRGGDLFLPISVADDARYAEIIDELSRIEGVETIKLIDSGELQRLSDIWLFPGDPLFRPLAADVRWPRFSAAFRYYTNESINRNELEASLGKTFSIVRAGIGEGAMIDVGFQAGANAVFERYTPASDLINADYMFGIPVTYRWKKISLMTRLYHTGSHLGNEFVFDNPNMKREKVSYESVNIIAALEPLDWLYFYGGGEVFLDPSPSSMKYIAYQAGLELTLGSAVSKLPDIVAAVHLRGMQANDYEPSVSVKLGFKPFQRGLISFDVYTGFSPTGQFFRDRVTYLALTFAITDL